uniref:Uncharacterized LOC100176714 n=1 Tax=Ciona intestinalis TaxID=7719 RepID=F6QEL1_CIOIN
MATNRYLPLALGVAVVGTVGVNIGHRVLQSTHKGRPYCTLPMEALDSNHRGTQLLGGKPFKMKHINLGEAILNTKMAKLSIPVKGNTRVGFIHTMSTRSGVDDEWLMKYAVMTVKHGNHKWNVWLHPVVGGDELLPEDVALKLRENQQTTEENQQKAEVQQTKTIDKKPIENQAKTELSDKKLKSHHQNEQVESSLIDLKQKLVEKS